MPPPPPPPQNPTRLTPAATDGPWADQLLSAIVHSSLYKCAPDWVITPFTVPYHGILLVLQGHGWTQINDNRYPLTPNTFTFLRAGDTLSAGHDPQTPVSCYSTGFLLKTQAGDDLITRRNWPDSYLAPPAQAQEWAALMAELTNDIKSRQTARQTLAHARLLLALDRMDSFLASADPSRITPRPGPKPPSDPRVAQLTAYVDANLHTPLTSAALAKRAHVSPTHLAHLFHQHALPTPMDYVRQRRIALACTLLATTSDKIATIAAATGYSDPFHFSRVFKKIQGLSPEAYRASCKHPFGS